MLRADGRSAEYTFEEFLAKQSNKYHFVLCANVLSTIPRDRTVRSESLQAIRRAVAQGGQVLFVNQHTNSYFTDIRRKSNTQAHLDGWISEAHGHFSYYGILNKETVVTLVTDHGFSIIEAWIDGQSNYVLGEVAK